jgi:hypothetical protein
MPMIALPHDAVAIEHEDAIERAHRRQPMRDYDRHSPRQQALDRLLRQCL